MPTLQNDGQNSSTPLPPERSSNPASPGTSPPQRPDHDSRTPTPGDRLTNYGLELLDAVTTRTSGEHGAVPKHEDSTTSIIKLLWAARLLEKRGMEATEEKWFIPHKQIQSICHFDAVYREVRKHTRTDEEAISCAEYVCGPKSTPSLTHASSSRKIFATLVLIRHLPLIFDFQKAGVRDRHLPFIADSEKTKLRSSHSQDGLALDFFGGEDDPTVVDSISKMQWSILVPYIARDADRNRPCDYQLAAQTIMPWTDFQEKVVGGGFGEVRCVKIHSDHHGFPYQAFALKTFYRNSETNKKDFEREIKAFRKVPEVPHLVELCATFGSGKEYQLLFPWADGGSLKDLWKTHPTSLFGPPQDVMDHSSTGDDRSNNTSATSAAEFVHWLAAQAHGLMCGLTTIHELPEPDRPGDEAEIDDRKLYGIHGDLKPQNILYFSQETGMHRLGTLKIADFGIMKFHSLSTRTVPNHLWMGHVSPTYRSPEHDNRIKEMMSRKVDIWAMGCVFSEMLTWALMDGSAVERYTQARIDDETMRGGGWREDSFFCRVPRVPGHGDEANAIYDQQGEVHMVKPSVSQWLTDLIDHAAPSSAHEKGGQTFLLEFLSFVKDRMLVTSREERVSSEGVVEFIRPKLETPIAGSYWTYNWHRNLPNPPGKMKSSATRVHFS